MPYILNYETIYASQAGPNDLEQWYDTIVTKLKIIRVLQKANFRDWKQYIHGIVTFVADLFLSRMRSIEHGNNEHLLVQR
jgi:hypothetical protein